MELYGFENLTAQVGDRFGFFKPPVGPGVLTSEGGLFEFVSRALAQVKAVAPAPTVTSKASASSTVTTQPNPSQKLQAVTQPAAAQAKAPTTTLAHGSRTANHNLGVEKAVPAPQMEVALVNALLRGEASNSNSAMSSGELPSLILLKGPQDVNGGVVASRVETDATIAEETGRESSQVLRAAAELFVLVDHVAASHSNGRQDAVVVHSDVVTIVSHLETILGVVRSEVIRPEAAHRFLQVARLVSDALRLQVLPLVSNLISQTRSEIELTRLIQTLEHFFQLPGQTQREIIETGHSSLQKFQQLVRQEETRLLPVAPEQEIDARQLLPQLHPDQSGLVPASLKQAVKPQADQTVLAPVIQSGESAIEGERSTPTARQIRLLGPALAQVVADISTLGLPLPLAAKFRQFLSQLPMGAPVRIAEMQAFVKQWLRHVPPASQTMSTLLKNIFHRSPNVRFLMVALLKELMQRAPKNVAEEKFIPLLKILARDRRSLKVRSEAIQVLLDMGNGQSKGRQSDEAMRALMEEIDLLPLLRDLLNPRNYRRNGPEEVRLGLSLLTKAGRYLHPEVRYGLLQFALEIAERHRVEEIKMAALDSLLTYHRDLDGDQQQRLRQKGIYAHLMLAVAKRYQAYHDNFVSNNGPQAVRYGT